MAVSSRIPDGPRIGQSRRKTLLLPSIRRSASITQPCAMMTHSAADLNTYRRPWTGGHLRCANCSNRDCSSHPSKRSLPPKKLVLCLAAASARADGDVIPTLSLERRQTLRRLKTELREIVGE